MLYLVLIKGGDYPLHILDGRKFLYQWDTNRQLTATNISVGEEFHFSNLKQRTALPIVAKEVDGKVVVEVPNILLQSSSPITVHRYVEDSTGQLTIEQYSFEVKSRPKPDDYVYTETEILNITSVVNKAIEDAVASGDFKGEKGEKGDKGEKGEKGDTGEPGSDGKNGSDGINGKDGADGKDGYTPKKGTDYWTDEDIAEIKSYVDEAILGGVW